MDNLNFTPKTSTIMHIDLNSCFATLEQQANPLLRNRPIAVAAYNSPRGIIIAPSVEAKKFGIKVGTRIMDAKKVCPEIKILEPDPQKYRYIHHQFRDLLNFYTNDVTPKSVDEFVINFENSPKYNLGILNLGKEIKQKIKDEIGEYITVSIGISKNKFLAKTASNLRKPDGLEEINEHNFLDIYHKLNLTDLCGIAGQNFARLASCNINTVKDFYYAKPYFLKSVFHSVMCYLWYFRLRGYEVENYPSDRKTFNHQYALPKPLKGVEEIAPVLTKLIEKLGFRLRNSGYRTQGVHLSMVFRDNTYWHMGHKTARVISDSRDIYKQTLILFMRSPPKEIKIISVSCFNLKKIHNLQLEIFEDIKKEENLIKMLDKINNRWGKFVISPAAMIGTGDLLPDRIGFGNV